MPLKKLMDSSFGPAIPINIVSNTEFPFSGFNGSYKIDRAIVVPTLAIPLDPVNYVLAEFINIGRNDDRNDVMIAWTNETGALYNSSMDAWQENNLTIIDGVIAGNRDVLKLKFTVGGGGANFGFPLIVISVEPL
jgi:hypothetical protein